MAMKLNKIKINIFDMDDPRDDQYRYLGIYSQFVSKNYYLLSDNIICVLLYVI